MRIVKNTRNMSLEEFLESTYTEPVIFGKSINKYEFGDARVLKKTTIVADIKFTPKQYSEFIKYNGNMCHSSTRNIINSYNEYIDQDNIDYEFCDCGIEEDMEYLDSVLREFGF